MSLSVLEALACGVPVIASPAAAEGLIEHGTNGIRLTDMSPKEIALHINDLYFDAKRLNSMSIYARKTAENYSWEKSVDEYEFQYRKLLQSRKVSAVNEVVNDPTNQI
jgi:glycosyltransferase involved in cell wall biosynthesis